jgi:hypothetical protein
MTVTAHLARRLEGSLTSLTRSTPMSTMAITASNSSAGSFVKDGNHFGRPWLNQRRGMRPNTIYQLTDRLHDGHVARVPGNEIAATVSSWLADLGAQSPLVDELARAVQHHDWPAAYAIGETLSVDVAVAS